jgi:hypothetical protein
MKKMKLVLMLLVVTFTIACGQKKDDTFSKPMYFPQGIYIGIDPVLHLTWPTGGSTIYPSAGIPLSTGTAWGTSIVNNSSAWNTAVTEAHTAFLYGPHAGLYKLLNAKVDYVTEVINKPAEVELSTAILQVPVLFEVLTQIQINALTPVKGKVVINSTDNVMQWYNGVKWIVFATTNN